MSVKRLARGAVAVLGLGLLTYACTWWISLRDELNHLHHKPGVVADVRGQSILGARNILEKRLNYKVEVRTPPGYEREICGAWFLPSHAKILTQDPSPGTEAPEGTTVTVVAVCVEDYEQYKGEYSQDASTNRGFR